jgi:sulfur relay (sulfurtransferase) complex TusBCD TusD component (DsrE family)
MMNDSTKRTAPVILITNDGMGQADRLLQHKLIRTYLSLLVEHKQFPAAICFYTDGVKLVIEGSPVLDLLQGLEASGVPLVICQTCLNHFNLADKVKVGVVGGMTDIIEAQWRADKVITL